MKRRNFTLYLTEEYVMKIRHILDQTNKLSLSAYFDTIMKETIEAFEGEGGMSPLFEKQVKDLTLSDLQEIAKKMMDAEEKGKKE